MGTCPAKSPPGASLPFPTSSITAKFSTIRGDSGQFPHEHTGPLTPWILRTYGTPIQVKDQVVKEQIVRATTTVDKSPREKSQPNSIVLIPNNKLPFGNIPRLLLAWVPTEAVRTQSREMGRSFSGFSRILTSTRMIPFKTSAAASSVS